MNDISERCQELLDEYRTLRRRLEEADFTNPEIDDASPSDENQADIDRLEMVREELNDECDIELPDEDEDDIDLPDYATGAPSEPMDFDAE